MSAAAGAITSIPGDADRREHERRAAERALGDRVAVDTSVVALGIRADLDVGRMSTAFKSVLVADELTVDARMAVASARRLADAVLGYDPGLGDHTFTEFDDQQRDTARERAERALGVLSGWQSVKSSHLRSPEPVEEGDFRPWDASVRVARAHGLALWCDDLALRGLAESQGITAFGTWALYETLASTARGSWLPAVTELKMRLLRAGIADVPISLSELEMAADFRDGPDAAIQHFLRRPLAWSRRSAEHHEVVSGTLQQADSRTPPGIRAGTALRGLLWRRRCRGHAGSPGSDRISSRFSPGSHRRSRERAHTSCCSQIRGGRTRTSGKTRPAGGCSAPSLGCLGGQIRNRASRAGCDVSLLLRRPRRPSHGHDDRARR